MATNVHELNGRSYANVAVDTVLVFPNIITCVALVAVSGAQLIGAHMTGFDDMQALGAHIQTLAGGAPSEVYAIGPISSGQINWNLKALGLRNIQQYDTTYAAGGIDVRVSLVGGGVIIEKKPHNGADGTYEEMSLAHFTCCTIL